MSNIIKKRLYKKTFYLDLKGYRHEAELVKDLKKFGARQECFLSKDVSFVVTNKSLAMSDKLSAPAMKSHPSGPSPSPVLFNESSLDNFDSRVYSSSPVPEASQGMLMSRGLSLVQKALQKREGTTDVLEVCRQWNIKVFHLETVLAWINKFKKYLKEDEENKATKKVLNNTENIHRLQKPYMKVEDKNRKFKTKYKLFEAWAKTVPPEIPKSVNWIQRQLQGSKSLEKPQQASIRRSLSRSTSLSSSFNSGKASSINSQWHWSPVASWNHSSHPCSLNPQPSNSHSFQLPPEKKKEIQNHSKENMKKNGKSNKKKPKKRYCEVCGKYFVSLDDHLKAESHKKFFGDPYNFQIIEEIILDLPKLDDLVKKIDASTEEDELLLSESDPVEIPPILDDYSFPQQTCLHCQQICDKMPCLLDDYSVPFQQASLYRRKECNEMPCLEAIEKLYFSEHTEPYVVNSNDYVSASSGTCQYTVQFPYLEDSGEKCNESSEEIPNNTKVADSRQNIYMVFV